MMPARWPEYSDKEVEYTLDNYYPPVFVDGRLYVFYEGVTSFDARGGKERLREKYRVNEDGLALTEAEPIFSMADPVDCSDFSPLSPRCAPATPARKPWIFRAPGPLALGATSPT